MTEEAKLRYEEDKPHYEVIRLIVQEEFKPIIRNLNWFFIVAIGSIGYLFVKTSTLDNNKANANETLGKLQYYQIEVDEHRQMQEVFVNPSRSQYIFGQINDNMERDLGFKFVNRGETK